MGTTFRIVSTLTAAIVLAVALRFTFGPAPIAASYASAKLGAVADPFAAPIEMAVSDAPKRQLAD